MIVGSHAVIYADNAEQPRAFIGDVLELPYVDAHYGRLVFELPPARLGIHPLGVGGHPSTGTPTGHHQLYLMCNDIEAPAADRQGAWGSLDP